MTGALEATPRASADARPVAARAAGASVVINPHALYSKTPATLPPLATSEPRAAPIPLRNLRRTAQPHPVPYPAGAPWRVAAARPPRTRALRGPGASTRLAPMPGALTGPMPGALTPPMPGALTAPPSPVPLSGIRALRVAPRVPFALVLVLMLAATGLGAAVVRNIVVGNFEERMAEERIAKAELLRHATEGDALPPLPPAARIEPRARAFAATGPSAAFAGAGACRRGMRTNRPLCGNE